MKRSYRSSTVGAMPRGNPAPKLSITVDAAVHESVVEAAAADGVSVSAWMTMAASRALVARNGLAGVAEWENINGAFTEGELAAARQRVSAELVTERSSESRPSTTPEFWSRPGEIVVPSGPTIESASSWG